MTCGAFEYRRDGNAAVIVRYLGPKPRAVQPVEAGKRVSVPEQLDGLPVAGIDREAFSGTGAVQVILPDRLRWIGSRAFAFCRFLREIRMPEGLEEIGREAFRGCASLKAVRVPDSVREIPPQAFQGCAGLVSAALPAGLESIGEEAFRDCSGLDTLLPEGLPGLRRIGEGAFRGCAALRELRLGPGIETVGSRAFRGCPQLTLTVRAGTPAEAYCAGKELRYRTVDADGNTLSVSEPPPREEYTMEETGNGEGRITRCVSRSKRITVPERIGGTTVTGIGAGAFAEAAAARSIVLPDTLKYIGREAFMGSGFREVTVGSGLEEIGEKAFSGCGALNAVCGSVPALRKIGAGAFEECRGLRSFDFPAGLREIGEKAFSNCTGLKSVIIPEGSAVIGPDAFYNCLELKEVRLPAGTAEIGRRAFDCCMSLETIDIPNPAVTVGTAAFARCRSLREIRLAPDHPRLSAEGGVLTDRAEHRAVAYCAGTGEKRCVIPEDTEIIGELAFSFAGMERVVMPEGVRVIEKFAFSDCRELRAVQLPGSLRVIGDFAFEYCLRLPWLDIPEGVEEIGAWAFATCVGMSRLHLPASLKTIGKDMLGWGGTKPLCVVPAGSYAEAYCRENGYSYEQA